MKSKQCILFLCCLFVTNFVYAQSSLLKGRISYFDSKNEDGDIQYVEGAQISSPYTKTIESDYKGRFSFKVDGSQSSDPIQLKIQKDGYEIVNQKEVDNAKANNKFTLRIFLVPEGEMDNLRNNLNRVASNHVTGLKEQMLDSIAFDGSESQTAIANLEKRSGQEIYNAFEAEEMVLKMNNHIEEQLPDYIYTLSKINPDFASKMFQRALNHYKNGDIIKAVQSINESKLAKGVNHIKAVLKDVKNDPDKEYKMISLRAKTLNQIKDSYFLKIISLQQSFQFVEANNVLQRLTKIAQLDPPSNDVAFLEKLKIPDLTSIPVEKVDVVLGEKNKNNKIQEEEIDYSKKEIFTEKGNTDAAKKDISMISQIGQKYNNNTIPEEETKSVADAEAHDFENTLFVPVETSNQLVTLLDREKKSGGVVYPKQQSIVVNRDVIRPSASTSPPPAIVNVERTPVVIPAPRPAVIDRRSYISVEEIVPMKAEVKAPENVRKKAKVYTRQSVTTRTSLRKSPTASSKVLKRLAVGTKVQVIEQVDKYWCRVLLNGREGYVKAFLLEK